MTHPNPLQEKLKELLMSQRLAVLSTHDQGQPYSSLVAFAATANLLSILFATPRTTRKFHNLTKDQRVSLLMDNRSNTEKDFHEAMAVTVIGVAQEVHEKESPELYGLYLTKHPYLEGFVRSESCALLQVCVQKYLLVNHFQEVFQLKVVP